MPKQMLGLHFSYGEWRWRSKAAILRSKDLEAQYGEAMQHFEALEAHGPQAAAEVETIGKASKDGF